METADVFLSHHVSSMNVHASKLDQELRGMGIKTFICTSMKPGDDFRQSIIVNAVKCKLFVAFINEKWADSEECITEFNCALRSFNTSRTPKIIPIIIGGFGWIDVAKYPDVYNITANTNCAVLNGNDWGKVFNEVISSIKASLKITGKTVEPGKTTEVKPNNVPINKLPEDVASDMKNCALSASWHCANTRFGHDAAADKMNFEKNADSFKMKLSGKLLADTCDEIKWMFWNAAWFTANTRVGYTTDAVRDKAAMEKHYRNYVKRGEMTVELADNIKWMGWRAAWYCANFRKGYHNDASKDEEAYKSHFNNIFG